MSDLVKTKPGWRDYIEADQLQIVFVSPGPDVPPTSLAVVMILDTGSEIHFPVSTEEARSYAKAILDLADQADLNAAKEAPVH